MVQCKNCEDGGAMYDKRNGQRCAICGYTWKPSTGNLEGRPTRAVDAECGELITTDTDARRGCVKKKVCNDGSACSMEGKAVVETEHEGVFMVACHHHS